MYGVQKRGDLERLDLLQTMTAPLGRGAAAPSSTAQNRRVGNILSLFDRQAEGDLRERLHQLRT